MRAAARQLDIFGGSPAPAPGCPDPVACDPEAAALVAELEAAEQVLGEANGPAACVAAAARCGEIRARLVAEGIERAIWRIHADGTETLERPTRRRGDLAAARAAETKENDR